MGDKSQIEWTDATWNPIRGCTRISKGCEHCYAERTAIRFSGKGQPYEGLVKITNGHPQWTGKVRFVKEHLLDPIRWRKPAAKNYRGGRYKRQAYDVKNWSLEQLCKILSEHGASRGITFGWKEDPYTPGFEWVLYVDLPQGQVSFHSRNRGLGPDYRGDWDRQRLSRERILAFCDNVLGARPVEITQLENIAPEIFVIADRVRAIAETLSGVQPSLSPRSTSDGGLGTHDMQPRSTALKGETEQPSLFPDVRKGE